jgi:hypothetical protein
MKCLTKVHWQKQPATYNVKHSLWLTNEVLLHEDVGGSGGIAPPFLNLAPDGDKCPASRPSGFTPLKEAAGTNWAREWVDSRAGVCSENRVAIAPGGNWTPGVQPVTDPRTHWSIKVKVKVKVMLRLTVSQSVCFGVKFTLELVTRYYFLSESCCVVSVGRPFWREIGSVAC